jgi:RimJ/RimL family protein N-acetyltransferase
MADEPIDACGFVQDIRLIPLAPEHAENMFRWMCDSDVTGNIGLRSEPSLQKTQAWIRRAVDDPQMRAYAVLLSGQHVGNIIFDRLDSLLANARMSMYLGERSIRGAGVGTIALRLALADAFESLSLHKVWLTVHVRNMAAIRTYLKLGFVMEGILRDEFRLNGQLIPVFYMGILREEFRRLHPEAGRPATGA